jgi:transposase
MAIELTDKERATLLKWVGAEAGEVRKVRRARIVLALAEGMAVRAVSREQGVDENTVRLWRDRFTAGRVDAIAQDAPRPGRPATIPAERKRAIVTLACQTKPENATHWNTREMAKVAGVSQSSVQRTWSSNGIKPHLVRTFKLSNDPKFEEKLVDVVGLYLNPPEKAMVLCVDEKSQIQALDRTQPGLPMKKGRCGTMTHDYKRHGTTTLFAALNLLDGTVIGSCKKQHRHEEFLAFLKELDKKTPKDLDLHVVLDNYGTHKHPNVGKWLADHPRFILHFVPTSCSWLNLVERFFAEITNKAIRRGAFDSVFELEETIKDYLKIYNLDAKPFKWTASAASILDKVKGCREINDSEH